MGPTAQQSRGKKFVRDLGIYAIGNIGSKLITFLLVPFYTYFITDPADFGYYDICLTAVFFICPFITFQLTEGGFRFLIETHNLDRKRAIVTFAVNTVVRNSIIFILLGGIIGCFVNIKYLWFIVLFGVSQASFEVLSQIVRGLGKTELYISVNICNSVVLLLLSVVTVAIMDLGILGVFIANISSRWISILCGIFKISLFRVLYGARYVVKSIDRQLIRYCLPLLPTVAFWWLLTSNNVFFIKQYLGLEENGIYAILSKFTSILFVIANIFYQTWQQNAIEQYNKPDRNAFFSKVFNSYFYLFCGLVIFMPFLLRVNYSWLVSGEYESSSQYLFLNSIYIMTFSISAFFDLGYQCSKQTKRILPSIVIASVINICGNYLLIRYIGLYGVITSGIITFIVLIVYRAIDNRKYMIISFSKYNIAGILLIMVGALLYQLNDSSGYNVSCMLSLALMYFMIMPKSFKQLLTAKIPFFKKDINS